MYLNISKAHLDGTFNPEYFRWCFDRAASDAAKNAATTAGGVATQEGSNANQINSTLVPYEEQQLLHPTGYTPEQLNNQLVGGEQGAGGAAGGITGEANLESARTRNSGGFSNALDKAARTKEQVLSGNSLGVANEDAKLQQEKQQQAAGVLQGSAGTDTEAMLKSMGIQTGDINTQIAAGKSGWLQNMTGVIGSLGQAASGAGSVMTGMGNL
jgi:hypothetical protein